jgi:dihydrodipicolinate synthase/N-acetylneuraminate lyase
MRPPKYVVEELFRTRTGREYRDTVHAKAVLDKVADIKTILYNNPGQLQCPIFKELMDWIGAKAGVLAY